MSKSIDLGKLREEIDTRKGKKATVAENLGEGTVHTVVPAKDEFLNGLLSSLQSGQPSHATNLIKMVENKTAEKQGEVRTTTATPTQTVATIPSDVTNPPVAQSPDREVLLYEELQRRTNEYKTGGSGVVAPVTTSHGLSVAPVGQPQTLNEDFVKQVINENFVHIVEHAMKDAIVEIYAVERIKEVIAENTDLIREVVINTIRELQKKKKTRS